MKAAHILTYCNSTGEDVETQTRPARDEAGLQGYSMQISRTCQP